jgi:hypothetical protein
MRTAGLGVLASLMLALSGCAAHRNHAQIGTSLRTQNTNLAPVVVADRVRESLPNDYMRVSFLPAGVQVTSLSRPGALRAFTTATPMYEPPLTVGELPYYSGLVNNDKLVLVAMRCHPPQPDKIDAVLATWPNVFAAIQRDVPLDASACSPEPSGTAQQVACYAKGFNDPPSTTVPTALAHTFNYAGVLFDADHAAMAKWLQDNYGIFPAFAGTGYSVKDSYSLSSEPMTVQQILVKSVSPEYILKNVSLADAGCRCIAVNPYDGRSAAPLDPDFIQQAGGDGQCQAVDRLRPAAK